MYIYIYKRKKKNEWSQSEWRVYAWEERKWEKDKEWI